VPNYAICTRPGCDYAFDCREELRKDGQGSLLPPESCPKCQSSLMLWCPICFSSLMVLPTPKSPCCQFCGKRLLAPERAVRQHGKSQPLH